MPNAKITSKGQVTIPVEVRAALELEQGDSIALEVRGDYAVMRKVPRLSEAVSAIHRRCAPSDSAYSCKEEAVAAHVAETWQAAEAELRVARPPQGKAR